LAVGTDLVEIARIGRLVERYGERFLARVYTPGERRDAGGRADSLALRWAAKEAASKALGTGIGPIGWREIEVVAGEGGRPELLLHGEALLTADALGLTHWAVSLTHEAGLALAFVVGLKGAAYTQLQARSDMQTGFKS
jgi:holo-[acyl-carrier protein] synthase